MYARFIDTVVPVSSTRAAEMTKLLENIFRCVNIALMNELLQVSERMGINIWEVVDAAKTKPFGFMPFYPGPGLGGHCIPIDPFYLSWKAREYDFHTEFIELAGKINENMPYYVVKRLMEALNTQRKPLAGSKILMLGVAYKKDIDDMRESPAIKIAELILEKDGRARLPRPVGCPPSRSDGRDDRARRCSRRGCCRGVGRGRRRHRPQQRRLPRGRPRRAADPRHTQRSRRVRRQQGGAPVSAASARGVEGARP